MARVAHAAPQPSPSALEICPSKISNPGPAPLTNNLTTTLAARPGLEWPPTPTVAHQPQIPVYLLGGHIQPAQQTSSVGAYEVPATNCVHVRWSALQQQESAAQRRAACTRRPTAARPIVREPQDRSLAQSLREMNFSWLMRRALPAAANAARACRGPAVARRCAGTNVAAKLSEALDFTA
jgi:hypothetical protein